MPNILSIQSHVAYGYVGNRAAVFPLQLMGCDVTAVNTVQFSNHTGYGSWTGEVFSADHVRAVLKGVEQRGVFDSLDALLTGYLGDPLMGEAIIETVTELRRRRPGLIWACDPVMGDVGRGFFVKDGIPQFFQERALPLASIMTPNQFELEALTDCVVETVAQGIAACRGLLDQGPETILVTSLQVAETPADHVQMLSVSRNGDAWLVETPVIPFAQAANGAGDAVAAIYLGHRLARKDAAEALALTASAIYGIFEQTGKAGRRELDLIGSQDVIRKPERRFELRSVG